MKKRITFILVVVLFCSFYSKTSASELCSSKGYSVFTVNGIFTNKNEAIKNKDKLKSKFGTIYNNKPLIIDYLYNPTHFAGVGDLIDAVEQGLFNQESDYDLVEMLDDASQKVTTQKLLLVAHSQGNFYANNFYDKVASQEGGVPEESIGVYGVGSPANSVAGGGKYLTSDTDSVIATLVARYIKILSPNIHIPVQKNIDGNGHSFSDVYLKYQGDKIVSDIKSSLNKLKENDEQLSSEPCISAPELSTAHKILGIVLAGADPVASVAMKEITGTYRMGVYIVNGVQKIGSIIGNKLRSTTLGINKAFKNLSANVVDGLPDVNVLTTINPEVIEVANNTPPQEQNSENNKVANVDDNISAEITPLPNEINNVPPPLAPDSPSETSHNSGGHSSASVPESDPLPATDPQPLPTENPTLPPSEATPPPVEDPLPPPPVLDTISPVITLVGDNSLEIIKDTLYTDAGATALDDIDGDITANIVTVNTVDTATLGTYSITYDVSDAHNNVAIQIIRTVNVIAPLPPPPPPLPDLTINENTTLTAGEYSYDNLIITNNSVLTLESDPESSLDFKGVKINAVNVTIDAGSSITADKKGFGPGQGPGISSKSDIGSSYGGLSDASGDSSVTYGSATMPIDLGSGGTIQSYGGGAIYLVVSNIFINNGVISSDGGMSSSGGSIYVSADKIEGNGVFHANGGGLYAANTFKSSGGGGRIALYYHTSSFGGTIEAKGGCGQYDGMTMSCGQNGTVGIFDESKNDLYVNSSWRFQKNDSPFNFNDIFLTKAQVTIEDEVEVNAKNITLNNVSTFTLSGNETINADALTLKGNSIITVIPEKILSLTIPDIVIEAGSSITVEAKGYITGPGTPDQFYEAGASYGGKGGGETAKNSYGSDIAPVDFGSGADGNRGGGAIRLTAHNSLQNNGVISASGISDRVSGGSIYVTANNVSGNGVFQANGGKSSWPYGPKGGGGGRIAIYYQALLFSGTKNVLAGVYCFSGCAPAGEAGSIKMIDTSVPVLSSSKTITSFNFTELIPKIVGIINEAEHTISLTVPFGTNVTALVPTIMISEKALVAPNNNVVQDFTNPITYAITAEDNSTQNYIVTVAIESDPTPPPAPDPEPDPIPEPDPVPDPIPDTLVPMITDYTLNEVAGDITTNPFVNSISLVFTANENTNWVSVKIEKEDDASIYKYFYPGVDCDGKNICNKIWDGLLAGDTSAPNGTYKIKVRIRDLVNEEEYDYFSPYSITIDTGESSPPPAE
jgi:hypothetical protein